jgi:hypothetical protein
MYRPLYRLVCGLTLSWPLLLSGCTSCGSWFGVDNCAVHPLGSMPSPVGTHARRIFDTQAAKAEADDFVIYRHEWANAGKELNGYGRYHLQQIAQRLPSVPFPVLIQIDKDQQLNEARRQVVVQFLVQAGITDAEVRVLVGFPEAEGLNGEEAERMYQQSIWSGYGNQGYGMQQGVGGPFGWGIANPFGNNRGFSGQRGLNRGGLGWGNYPF